MTEQNTVYELDATKARKITQDAEALNGSFAREQTKDILKSIQAAANNASTAVDICGELLPMKYRTVIINRLKALGFEVVHNTGDQRDPYDYYTISW